jgi:hypothetical protein
MSARLQQVNGLATLLAMASDATGLRERKKQRTRQASSTRPSGSSPSAASSGPPSRTSPAAADIAPAHVLRATSPRRRTSSSTTSSGTVRRLQERLTLPRAGRDGDRRDARLDRRRSWPRRDFDDPRERLHGELIRTTPPLREHDPRAHVAVRGRAGDAVASDLGADQGPLRPSMVAGRPAGAALSMLEAFYDEKVELLAGDADPLALIDEALTFLRGGIEALRERPPAPVPVREIG